MIPCYALPRGVGLSGHGVITRALAALPGLCGLRCPRGDHHGLADHHVFTGSAVCGAAARLGTARRGLKYRTAAEAALEPEPPAAHGVGWGFISLYTLAYMSTSLLFIAPLLVTLALKVNSLVGIERAPDSLALVAGIGALLAMVGNPFFGRMSDRTASRLGMRRPWMVIGLVGGSLGILVVALAPDIPIVLAGWCIAQLFFNALLAAMVAVLPDQVPSVQRGLVSGVLGVCLPIASVCGTFRSSCSPATCSPCSWPRARSADYSSSFSRSG